MTGRGSDWPARVPCQLIMTRHLPLLCGPDPSLEELNPPLCATPPPQPPLQPRVSVLHAWEPHIHVMNAPLSSIPSCYHIIQSSSSSSLSQQLSHIHLLHSITTTTAPPPTPHTHIAFPQPSSNLITLSHFVPSLYIVTFYPHPAPWPPLRRHHRRRRRSNVSGGPSPHIPHTLLVGFSLRRVCMCIRSFTYTHVYFRQL